MILMMEKIGQGPTRRCDQRCYGARGGQCTCICGGRNHGAGIDKALANVREHFAPLVLCEHDKIIGTCEQGCTKPKGRVGEVQVPRRVMRQLKYQQEQRAC